MQFKIPFSGRAHTYTQEEIDIVVEAMQTAEPLTQGKYQQQFQQKFCQLMGVKHAFAVNNATAALEMAAQLCQFEKGDEVIIPSHTFTSSAYPFAKKGANIVWADIDSTTKVVTAKTLEKCITEKTKAIVVVHLYGYGADMLAIMALAKQRNLLVIEDTAQALGVEIEGQKAGTFGDFGVYSFHSHKNITTLGEGGMLTVQNDKFAKLIPMLRHNGHCSFDYERQDYWVPAMSNLDFPELNGNSLWPNNYCLGEIECALGNKLLDRLEQINQEKREKALWFIDELKEFPELEFHRVDSTRHNYHLLVARLGGGKRDAFIRDMVSQHGIQCVVQYYPLNRYPLYKKAGFAQADCPMADDFFDNMVSFPFQHTLTSEQLEYMLVATHQVLKKLNG